MIENRGAFSDNYVPADRNFVELRFRGTPSKSLNIRDGVYVFLFAQFAAGFE